MDSSILNAFHDEPFDATFNGKYTDTDFWSSEGDTMGLAETLHGILPISATEDATQLYASSLLKDDTTEMMHAAAVKQNSRNVFANDTYMEQSSKNNMLARNAFQTYSDDDGASSSDDDEDDVELKMHEIHNMVDFERLSQSSQHTFRSRTDSSSIGDYESHSSDYDDTDDAEDDEDVIAQLKSNDGVANNLDGLVNGVDSDFGLLAADDFDLNHSFKFPLSKNRTISTNTIGSDVDGFGLHIDTNNFDLAEFITKDDFFTESLNDKTIHKPDQYILQQNALENRHHSKSIESDAESDIIVDVETVEIEDELEVKQKLLAAIASDTNTSTEAIEEDLDLTYVDNTKRDPEWCPTAAATRKAEQQSSKATVAPPVVTSNTAPAPTAAPVAHPSNPIQRNYPPMVPNKKQCDILKRKFGTGRGGKNLMAQRQAKLAAKKAQEQQKSPATNAQGETSTTTKGLGLRGKNLSLLKHESLSISEQSSEENSTPIKQSATPEQPQQSIKQELKQESPKAVKRKLNLEEYKLRRSDNKEATTNTTITNNKLAKPTNCNPVAIKCNPAATKCNPVATKCNPTTQISLSPKKMQMAAGNHQATSEAVKTVVQNLKAAQTMNSPQQQQKVPTDPITEAKNKVLRMQELKRAQQIKILDSTLSAKVPRVTKLLPLKEIVKDTYPIDDDDEQNGGLKGNPDYEEIIIVSVSCNTDISLSPKYKSADVSSRSLLKASVKLQLSTGSLLASIQNEVVKKTQENNKLNVGNGKSLPSNDKSKANSEQQHGEDKIIMHLRKDRIRQRTFSMGTQTELLPEFPLLPFPKAVITHKSRERTRRQQKRRNYRQRSAIGGETNSRLSAYSSSESDSSRSCTRSRSRSRDYSSSLERLRTAEGNSVANGGYSSRSSRRHRSSVSSSYSENEHKERRRRRRYSYKKTKTQRDSRSSSTSSMSDYSTRSRSRTRSRSPIHRRDGSRSQQRSFNHNNNNNRNNYVDRNVSQPAVEERRIVYVGRIEQETTKEMLRRKFLAYGNIKQVTIHFKDTGMKYGFVTYERSQDAFNAIDNSTRDPQISAYDVSFGGRRAFCRASYADLDNAGINTYQSFVYPQAQAAPKKEEDSFEALLLKVKAKLNANKTKTTTTPTTTANDNENGKM